MDGMPAQYLYISQGFTVITQGLNNSMACGRSNSATIQTDVFDAIQPKISALAQQLDNTIDECYNDEMSEKATMQIRR